MDKHELRHLFEQDAAGELFEQGDGAAGQQAGDGREQYDLPTSPKDPVAAGERKFQGAGPTATPTIGLLRWMLPADPANSASPNVKIPPSLAAIQ